MKEIGLIRRCDNFLEKGTLRIFHKELLVIESRLTVPTTRRSADSAMV